MPLNRPLPTIYFVRHGETDWNKQGLIQGSVETELNATGLQQVQDVATAIAAHRDEIAGCKLVCSPQLRAKQTMGFITAALGVSMASVTTEPRVRELGFGIWEGKPFWELKDSPLYPADAEGRYYWRPEGGESYQDGVARVDDWLSTVTQTTLVVAHGAVGRCLMGYVAGLEPAALVNLKTPQGCYCKLENGTISWFDANRNAL
ncbi:MAG: histidine phosphatase family protein [Alphaproteobacteria bacterium]|nr:histidine phosphatase family protein [Alphaproteobacteria bacterium]